MREQFFVIAEFCFSQVEEHDGSVEAISVSMDCPVVLVVSLQSQQIGREILIRVLVNEGPQFLDVGDVVAGWFASEESLEIRQIGHTFEYI